MNPGRMIREIQVEPLWLPEALPVPEPPREPVVPAEEPETVPAGTPR